MTDGLFGSSPSAHMLWFGAGFIVLLVALFYALDYIREIRHRREFQRYLEREGGAEPQGEPAPPTLALREGGSTLRARFLRRIQTGFSSTRQRGFGQPPWKSPDEWSPLDSRRGHHEPK